MLTFKKKEVKVEKETILQENQRKHEETLNKIHALMATKEFKAIDNGVYLTRPAQILDALLDLESKQHDPVKYAFTVSKLLSQYKTLKEVMRSCK